MSVMKDSGIKWIGKIPKEWRLSKIKYEILDLYSGGTPESGNSEFYSDDGAYWVAIGDMSSCEIVKETECHITPMGIKDKNLKLVPKGTILYSIYATIGKVAKLAVDAYINQALLAIFPNTQIDNEYLRYTLKSIEDYALSECSISIQNNLNSYKVKNFPILVFNKKEQQLIAKFLDNKVKQIDEILSDLSKEIGLLDQYKKSLITEKVTKGLDPNVNMKDSGIYWIGKIPEHWNISKNKYRININNGREVEVEDGEIPVYGTGGTFKTTNKVIYEGKSVLLGRKGTIDKPLFVDGKFWTVDTVFYTTVKQNINIKLFYYLACCFDYKYYQTGSTLPSMTQTDLGSIYIPDIPQDEQVQIIQFLDRECEKIDTVVNDKRYQLEKMEKYKKSLIYEYVTGKKRVKGAEELYG